jgi:hypothetical protein
VAPPPVVASPAGVAPQMMHLLKALSDWRSIVPDHLNQPGNSFSVEAAQTVVVNAYRRERASWWSGIGAGSLPATWHAELMQDWWIVTLFHGMTAGTHSQKRTLVN